jgi:glucose-1-phosphate thymidylyltransferase
MKCLILAAGYATRLYPLTENFPKPLLEVAGKTITDWLVDDIASTGAVDGFAVVTNSRFASFFHEWASRRLMDSLERLDALASDEEDEGSEGAEGTAGEHGHPGLHNPAKGLAALSSGIAVVDDGTSTNETRLGAVRDIALAINTLGWDDDILVVAGDNVLDFSLSSFIEYSLDKGTTCIMRYPEPDPARLRKSGILEIGEGDLVVGMEEKPAVPRSNWCCPPFYAYSKADAAKVSLALAEGCGADAPGSFIAWLCSRSPVHAMLMPGSRYDIGDLESYKSVCRTYRGVTL